MANVAWAYGMAKKLGIDTKGMSPQEVIEALNNDPEGKEVVSKMGESREKKADVLYKVTTEKRTNHPSEFNVRADSPEAAKQIVKEKLADLAKDTGEKTGRVLSAEDVEAAIQERTKNWGKEGRFKQEQKRKSRFN